ncbi:MAG: DUF2235 domain-containing protein [Gammaproteobacteria bacterium]
MAKKLIVFCDGTWNTPDEKDKAGKACPTNVSKLFRATCETDYEGNSQITHYVQGVGSHPDDKIRGGVFGMGISKNILDGYQFICSNYFPGDQVYIFGFSRGAYTARSLAGLIYNMGILKREHFDQTVNAYNGYRNRADEWHPTRVASAGGLKGSKAQQFRKAYSWQNEKIHFLGVWDTVGALGAPYGLILGWLFNRIFKCRFHDTQLTPIIDNGYHAVSKDEKRWPFRPSLWDLSETHDPANFDQRWFDGVHSDIGGGYADAGLSDYTLEWMADKAKSCGMKIDLDVLDPKVSPQKINPHNSQAFYYQWSALLIVKWPAIVFVDLPGKIFKQWPKCFYDALNRYRIIAEPGIGEKIARIDSRSGNYNRKILN